MAPRIDKKLLPVKIHYFLRYGGCAIGPFLPVIVRQLGLSSDTVGLLWSAFNICNIVTFLSISKIADAFSIHRALFFFSSISILSGLLGIYSTPKFELNSQDENSLISYVNIILSTRSVKNSLLWEICSGEKDIESPCLFNFLNNTITPCTVRCELSKMMNSSRLKKQIDSHLDFPANSTNLDNAGKCLKIDNPMDKFDFDNQTYQHEITSHICQNYYSNSQNAISLSVIESMGQYQFWLILLFLVMNFCGMSIAMCMCDTAVFEILGEERHKFGTQRLFGSLAIGLMGISFGAVVDYFNQNQSERDYTSAFVLSSIMLILSFIAGVFIEFKIPKKIKNDVESGVWKIIGSMDVFLFLAMVMTTGISQGPIWSLFFLYMEDVSLSWDSNFLQRNLLQGLSMAIGCFLGEVPFNHVAGYMMQKVGHIKLLAFGIAAYSVRFMLYYLVTNPWYFLPIELLHGLSFGITLPVQFTYASVISTPGTKATMQGITSAVFTTGVCLSSLVSGILYKAIGGDRLFLYLGLTDAAAVLTFLPAHFLIGKMSEKPENKDDIADDDDLSKPLNDGNSKIQVLAKAETQKNEDVL